MENSRDNGMEIANIGRDEIGDDCLTIEIKLSDLSNKTPNDTFIYFTFSKM